MREAMEYYKKHYQSQFGLTADLWRLGLDYCERLAGINNATVRTSLAAVKANRDALCRGEFSGCVGNIGRVAAAHWSEVALSGSEFGKDVAVRLTQRTSS